MDHKPPATSINKNNDDSIKAHCKRLFLLHGKLIFHCLSVHPVRCCCIVQALCVSPRRVCRRIQFVTSSFVFLTLLCSTIYYISTKSTSTMYYCNPFFFWKFKWLIIMNRIHQPSAEQLAAEEIEIQSWNSNFFGSFVCDFGLDCISIIPYYYLPRVNL